MCRTRPIPGVFVKNAGDCKAVMSNAVVDFFFLNYYCGYDSN